MNNMDSDSDDWLAIELFHFKGVQLVSLSNLGPANNRALGIIVRIQALPLVL